jgi:transcription elongation factor Elf1
MLTCPACNADMPILLGVLGNIAHLRCRCCGIDYSAPADSLEIPDED